VDPGDLADGLSATPSHDGPSVGDVAGEEPDRDAAATWSRSRDLAGGARDAATASAASTAGTSTVGVTA